MKLVLGSGSPRRARLLAEAGYQFEIAPAGVDEAAAPGETAADMVVRLAKAKADAVVPRHPDSVVLTADTVVVLDGRVLGKPTGPSEAAQMLRDLSGREHLVLTGSVVAHPIGSEAQVTSTRVAFRRLDASTIGDYVDSGEPMDKAGAYAIQGGAAAFVEAISGPFDNVVGLPIDTIRPVLAGLGIQPRRR